MLSWCLAVSVIRLARAWRVFRHAQRIVVMAAGGFGHTITAPDVLRRLYKGERLVFVAMERSQHNPHAALLWRDVDVLSVPLRCRVPGRPYLWWASPLVQERVARVLMSVLSRCTSADVMDLVGLYDRAAALRYIAPLMGRWPRYTSYWMPAWERILADPAVARAALPEPVRGEIWAAIAEFAGVRSRRDERLCCLYLRAKGVSSGNMTSANRSSGPLNNYVPAIEHLVRAGYLVLVTGDRGVDRPWAEALGRRVVCAEWLPVRPALFSLFVNTEADVWIGQQGGPCVLPVVNGTPMLVVDAFPFGNALPNARMHYKTVRDAEGRLVHYTRLFDEYAYEYAIAGLCDNSAGQILDAVSEFIESLGEPFSDDDTRRVLEGAPDHVLTKHVSFRLSPAWLRLFGEGTGSARRLATRTSAG